MKKLFFIALLFSLSLSAQNYTPLNYYFNGTPTHGVKIKTNLPYTDGSQMPTIIIEGYNYGKSQSIGLILNYYIYNGGYRNYAATSFGAYAPPIQLANENGKVVIFLDSREYFNRFQVRTYAKGLSQEYVEANFQNWHVVDEVISGTNVVTVPYKNNVTGDMEIVGSVNIGGTENKSLRVRHINGKNGASADFDHLFLNYSTGKDVWIGSSGTTSNLITYGRITGNSFTSKSSISVFSNEVGEPDKRLTINTNDADNTYIYNYDSSNNSFHTINLGGTHSLSNGLTVFGNGDVGIGTDDTQGFKLGVDGRIAATEVKVATYSNWPDFVFNKDYNLPTLEEVEKHIKEKGHLKNIPSAKEVKENDGIELGEMNRKLLQKIEELTLYTIQQQKELKEQKSKIEKSQSNNEKLLSIIKKLEKRINNLEKNK
ncbi:MULTISPECIES: hypothetical protein [unclassified Tenacibaculum]|uniref:hypothetical protein n=1 Tax=unclassified Tenacibaculum TaxID=2635139 RepID=UPI001F197769|nr:MULTISPECIES: hypothetical protein [unclassified Tenacibaculum]MCF2875157.1 hypothetical protein [Tenacibaculum sp. Cn5-1]MCF2935233.1 hypothetical protein [Tenacibaculum sp. Cn5-34]MCG7511325.1 hypothetical protein [Tenacibaculum sp. Cn5-46]